MADKRTDPGQYYPGGRVIARQGTAPQQVVVDWNDIRNKPQVAPLPERFRDDDMKTKINEIASKFATVLAVAVAGWTAFCGVTVHTAPKGEIWNDAQIVTSVTYSADLPGDYAAVSNAALYASNRVDVLKANVSSAATAATNYTDSVRNDLVYDLQQGYIVPLSSTYADSANYATMADNAGNAANADNAANAAIATFASDAGLASWANDASRAESLSSPNENRLANEIFAALDAAASEETVTNIVRDLSLGGIWDETMHVWWTPRMRNGSLTYEATTNVNLNAGN